MKRITTALIPIFLYSSIYAQIEVEQRPEDTILQKSISNILLADNQFFDCRTKDLILLLNVVAESGLNNRDSLFRDSKYYQKEILKEIGEKRKNELITIGYIGKTTDKYNRFFSYKNNLFIAEEPLEYMMDTLIAPDSLVRLKLNKLRYNRYVRHKIDDNKLTLEVTVLKNAVTLDSAKIWGNNDAADFMLYYIYPYHNSYHKIRFQYFDKYLRQGYGHEISINDIILLCLRSYVIPETKQ